jgi:hypothetical protein
MVNHWTWYTTISSSINEPFVPNEDKFGFVYIITNTKTSKAYVGCKQYYLGKSKKQSSWQTYMGSSKYLKEDIKKIGKEHFTFKVIAEYKNKRSLRYYEAYYQMKWNVLTATIEGSDEPAYYNSYVGGKWYRPIESYQDPEYRRKISEAHLGKKFTEETKRKMSESQLGIKHTEESKRKMSEAKLGTKHTEETKRKLSEDKIGEKNPMYGRKHTEESKIKMSKSHLRKKHTEESKRKIRNTLKETLNEKIYI